MTRSVADIIAALGTGIHVDGAWRDHLLVARTREEHGRGVVAELVAAGFAQRI